MKAIIGKKVGMTQVFDAEGRQVPVTVIETGPCTVVQKKTFDKDGYDAVQLGYEDQKEQRLTRALNSHFKKANAAPKRVLREVRLEPGDEVELGQEVNASMFADVSHVDVTGVTKGRGFQGVVRRHGMRGGRGTHGSTTHRGPGSVGQCEYPARIFKNKKMPGQMGHVRVTTQNLKVEQVRPEDNVILVRGAVPGPVGGVLMVRKALKKVSVS